MSVCVITHLFSLQVALFAATTMVLKYLQDITIAVVKSFEGDFSPSTLIKKKKQHLFLCLIQI